MVSLGYIHPERLFSVSSFAYYSRSTATDHSYDVLNTYIVTSLEIPLTVRSSISFDVLFNQYKDTIYNASSYQETLGRVMYRLFRF
jgi:hypothetical protein